MKVPLEWLADYVDFELPAEELAHRLTMTGLKVESIEHVGGTWHDVYIGQVVHISPHPTSNKPLHVATVDLGGRTITVVTGAQNVGLHDKAPVVLVGGMLPHGPDGAPMRIEARPMAGIVSEGMLSSARELGISDEHSGIYILPVDAPVGSPLRSYMGGPVLDIETNPNRPDTLSIIGIAREVAAITQQQLTVPDLDTLSDEIAWVDEESIDIEVRDPDLCPRYTAVRVSGVEVGDSPFWMANRLLASGMRPINSLVDITNYVMLEYGQPMHAFDAAQLTGDRIVVRRAAADEELTTLDGVKRTLTRDNLVIADGERAVGIAGVMGGENSEIAGTTSTIVLESANFDPVSVRRTAKASGLRTEASARFEKGLPAEQTMLGLKRYLQLLAQISNGPLRVNRISDVWPEMPSSRVVTLTLPDLHRLVGVPISEEAASDALSLLGFGVTSVDGAIEATVPFWRRTDVELPADLVEEVARIVGFDAIPSTLPSGNMPPLPLPSDFRREGIVRERLLAVGANEAATHSLTSRGSMARLSRVPATSEDPENHWSGLIPNPGGVRERGAEVEPVMLLNPATADRSALRLTLVPSLLDVVARNLKHTDERLAFFEMGRTFFRRPNYRDLPYERRTLAVVLSGHRRPRSWDDPEPGPYTFFDVKGMIEAALDGLQVRGWETLPARHPALHPGRSALLRIEGHDAGYLGELHPEVTERFEIDGWPVQVAEIDLDALFAHASDLYSFEALPRYPAAYRDLAIVVRENVPAADVLRVVREAGGYLLESARIFDVYQGASLPEGSKSIAIGLSLRAPGATLTQEEIGASVEQIVTALSTQLEARLRD